MSSNDDDSADVPRASIPVRYGHDIRNFWSKEGDPPEHPEARVAWRGTNALTAENGVSFKLYRKQWENPHTDIAIRRLDLVSTMTDCAPFIVAVSAD